MRNLHIDGFLRTASLHAVRNQRSVPNNEFLEYPVRAGLEPFVSTACRHDAYGSMEASFSRSGAAAFLLSTSSAQVGPVRISSFASQRIHSASRGGARILT